MAKPTVADYLLERLRAWDVTKVFAYPGDGINGILAAWGRAGHKLDLGKFPDRVRSTL